MSAAEADTGTGDVTTDRVAFAREVLGLEVFDHQAEALRSSAPVVVIAGGRRSGKSVTAQVAALHACFVRRGAQVLVVTTAEEKVREFIRECAELLRGSPFGARSTVDERARRLTLSNKSAVVGLPPTAGQIRGRGADVFGVVVDEAGFASDSVWRDLRFVLLDHHAEGAQAWLVSSPWGGPDHFFRTAFERGMEGDQDYAAFRWPTTLNPRVPADWVERERGRLTSAEAASELDGEWPDAFGSLISRELLARQVADLELPSFHDLEGQAAPALGLDWGYSYDRSAATALFRLPVESLNPDADPLPRFVAVPHVWRQGAEAMTEVVPDVVAARRSSWRLVSTETNGIGAVPSQEVRRHLAGRVATWNLCATTNAKKVAGYAAVLGLLERGQLVLPRHPDLLRQLAGLKFEHGDRGMTRIEALDDAVHDDIADSLMLAMGTYARDGRAHVAALQAASRESAVPDAMVGALDVEVVETGGGLRVWGRPPLQGFTDLGLTLPAGVQRREPRPVIRSVSGRLSIEERNKDE